MSKVVLNIPHSSKYIPKWAMEDIFIPYSEVDTLNDFMVDKDVDKLWEFVPKQYKQIAEISRLIVDTERYRNDNNEEMHQKGMGVYYTHTPDGKQFRLRNNNSYFKSLEIYDAYHNSLENKVSDCIKKHGKCIILDCHSFHDKMCYTGHDSSSFPDVCIGTNGELSTEAKKIVDIFEANRYSVKINEPFAGALIPQKFLNDRRVTSVMIELNRRIYDNESFSKIQSICRDIYTAL